MCPGSPGQLTPHCMPSEPSAGHGAAQARGCPCGRGLQLHHSLTLCEMLARAVGWLRPMGPPISHPRAPALPSHPLQHQMGRVLSGCWLPPVPPCPVGLSWPHGEDAASCCHPWVLLMAAPWLFLQHFAVLILQQHRESLLQEGCFDLDPE